MRLAEIVARMPPGASLTITIEAGSTDLGDVVVIKGQRGRGPSQRGLGRMLHRADIAEAISDPIMPLLVEISEAWK
jgi:hypothetical protein